MNASENKICSLEPIQIEIVPQRILGTETASKLLTEIYNCGHILRVMIQGSNLPNVVISGPGKGEKINHPLKTSIDINGQNIDINVTVGRLYLEVDSDEIASLIYEKCKKVLKFPFEYYKGAFFKKQATIVDYAKLGPNSDKRLWGLSDPKQNIQDQVKFIKLKNGNE